MQANLFLKFFHSASKVFAKDKKFPCHPPHHKFDDAGKRTVDEMSEMNDEELEIFCALDEA